MKATVAPYETAAWCVRIECTNGTIVRLTSFPGNLTMSNAEVYLTDSGYETTAFSSTSSASPSAIDIEGIAGIAGISHDEIASGVFDNARIYIFKCDFLAPVEDYEPVTLGFFGKTTLEDEKYRVEGMSISDALNQSVGRTYTASCSRTFGDAGCAINLSALTVTGAVTSVTSNSVFRDSSRSEAVDHFIAGTFEFTSGLNSGLKPLEIRGYAADGTITVFEGFFYAPAIGDTYTLKPGCRKRLVDCQARSNVPNFFGFPNIPTSSAATKFGGQS
ncbi:MAG: DUF2163 domain-containing protein [Rhizobiales bacterium]|nr:DUF2163 domain-containing protein [Hyphomicrobiales bacterium]